MARKRGSGQSINAGRASLDASAAYLRHRGQAVIGWYLVAIGPLLLAAWWWIGSVASGDRLSLGPASVAITLAMLWRWAWLVKVHQQVMRDVGMIDRKLNTGLVVQIVLFRLIAHVGMGWGALLILPGVWSFYLSAFITPVMLMTDKPAASALRYTLGLITQHLRLLVRHGCMLTLLALLTLLAMGVSQAFLTSTVLPSLLGVDASDLAITLSSSVWWMFMGLMVMLAFDLYWSVGSVLLLQQLEARQTGADLRARLGALAEANP